MVQVIGVLSVLSICVASLGLLGMVVFTTETRLREVGIRKVLGATEASLALLLSGGFLVMLAIAALIAVPLTYLLFEDVILSNLAYHQPVGAVELLVSVALVLLIALLIIGFQTFVTARSNPSTVLRSE
jgi:putative ABC transport system permease protein